MQISGSIFAVKDNWFSYAKILKESKVDYLHIDLFDNKKSQFELNDITQFDESYLPLDVHLIYSHIKEQDIKILNNMKVYYLNIQYENLIIKDEIIDVSKNFNGNFGISITSETPLTILDQYMPYLSQVLIMCSKPGVSGATFDETNYSRIEAVREKYPTLPIFADGGINDMNIEKMGKLGVKLVVSGSFLAKGSELISQKVYSLKFLNEYKIPVTRIMIPKKQLPVISKFASFIEIISIVTTFRLGIAFVLEEDNLVGVITDGDIRRGYLKYKEQIFHVVASKIMNTNPVCVSSTSTVEHLFNLISQKKYKGVYVIPIIEEDSMIGAINLHFD